MSRMGNVMNLVFLGVIASTVVWASAACAPDNAATGADVEQDSGVEEDTDADASIEAPAPDAGRRNSCNDLTSEGLTPATVVHQEPGALTGGTLLDGTYVCVEIIDEGSFLEKDSRVRKLRIEGSTVQSVTNWDDLSGPDVRATETWTIDDDTISITKTCPASADRNSLQFAVVTPDGGSGSTRLLIADGDAILVFERQ